MSNVIKRNKVFVWIFIPTVIYAVGALTLSFNSFVDKAMFGFAVLLGLYCFIKDMKYEKNEIVNHIKGIYLSSKWLLLAIGAYFIWEIITLFYTKDFLLALKRYPFRFEYLFIMLLGLYFCRDRQRTEMLFKAFASVAVIVALYAYCDYFISTRPLYFQRLSTARDYNVFSTVMLFSMLFFITYLMSYSKYTFKKRMLILLGYLIFTMPAYYLSGSRRHIIMAPIFFAFAVIYAFIANFPKKKENRRNLAKSMAILAVCALTYIGACALTKPFSDYGSYRAQKYLQWISNATPDAGNDSLDKEVTISHAINTITDATMTNKRMLIYSVAFNEIKSSSITKLVFGGGSSYDIYMYDNTNDKALLDAYKYNTTDKRPASGWMYSHNFLISDMLCGGIIQLLLGLNIVAALIYSCIKAIKLDKRCGIMLVIPTSMIVVNNFISSPYGFLNDLLFYLVVVSICATLYINSNPKKGLAK